MTVLAQRVAIRKDADFEELHPRGHGGRFRKKIGDFLKTLAETWGDDAVVAHREVGADDHDLSDHGVVALHSDGMLSISRVMDDDEPIDPDANASGTVGHLDHDDAGVLADWLEMAVEEANKPDLEPGRHGSIQVEDDEEALPIRVDYGKLTNGQSYIALSDATDEEHGHGLQLTPEHAEELIEEINSLRDAQWRQQIGAGRDPFQTGAPTDGEEVVKKIAVRGDQSDVFLASLDTPTGRAVRLGLGGTEEMPLKNFGGGPGPMVAYLGPDQARELDQAIDEALTEMKAYHKRQNEAWDAIEEWQDSDPQGQRWIDLHEQYDIYRGADDDQHPEGLYVRERGTGRRGSREYQHGPDAPPEIYAEYERLEAEKDKIFAAHGVIDDEGVEFDRREIETYEGTIVMRFTARDPGSDPYVEISVRPGELSSDEDQWDDAGDDTWYDVRYQHEAYSQMEAKELKVLRKKIAEQFADPAVTKSAGSATDTPGAGRARALKRYWTRGKGLAKWVRSAHPWTTLHRHLGKYIHDPDKLDRTTSAWFHAATGMWSGERKGKNPLGRG